MGKKLIDVVVAATEEVAAAAEELVDQVSHNVEQGVEDAKKRSHRCARSRSAATNGGPRKRCCGKVALCGKILAAGVIVAGVIAAVRQFIATKDSGWQAHAPSNPYVSPPASNIAEDIAEDIETDSTTDSE